MVPPLTLRLVEIRFGKTWYSIYYSVLEPVVLPPYVVADLYRRRWRIEEAFNTGLAVAGFELFMDGFNQWCEIPCSDLAIICCCALI